MGIGTGFDIGIYQKLLIVKNVALKSCPPLKLVLWQLVLDRWETGIRPATKSLQTQNSSPNEKYT